MTFPWQMTNPVLDDALHATMKYLEYTGAAKLDDIEELCATIILIAYMRGERDGIKLSNCAIDAVEKPIEDGVLGFPVP